MTRRALARIAASLACHLAVAEQIREDIASASGWIKGKVPSAAASDDQDRPTSAQGDAGSYTQETNW